MLNVHLSDEEKLQVLLLALILFLIALFVSICLASSLCPLNKWLLERHHKKRRQQLSPPAGYLIDNAQLFQVSGKNSLAASYAGPPPAYEAALRATRLQSLTGSLPPLSATQCQPPAECWPSSEQLQLDFGDYFHQPREMHEPSLAQVRVNMLAESTAVTVEPASKQLPVMLRLWVRMLEPAELVSRACQRRASVDNGLASGEQLANRRDSQALNRQLSIPQFFGSLITTYKCPPTPPVVATPPTRSQLETEPEQQTCSSELTSLDSNSTSSSGPPTSSGEQNAASNGIPRLEVEAEQRVESKKQPVESAAAGMGRRKSSLAADSVMSRVLHMNVASFSYAKDESLISTKRHNQVNSQQFHLNNHNNNSNSSNNNHNNKLCQLMISVCDVENLLGSSWLNERSCALLASHSAIYVRCEILLPSSKSTRLLRYPLRAIQQQSSSSDLAARHTVNLSSTIPAVSMEPANLLDSRRVVSQPNAELKLESRPKGERVASTNWRHKPSADGKSVVVFSSVPKQVAHQQQLAAAGSRQSSVLVRQQSSCASQVPDLVQFDSVFVSPILNKSSIIEGHIRFRIYSQCKYVNESCLAELKLPLKQLLQSDTRDNLGDARPGGDSCRPQRQADFILNNLLANLVTASTGSPLGSLVEQISSQQPSEDIESSSNSFRLPGWLSTSSNSQSVGALRAASSNLKASSSFNESLYRLVMQNRQAQQEQSSQQLDEREARLADARRLEQNYCRSLMISHWLNYLQAPSYECQLTEESRGQLILGLTYLPTSNRLIFNAHRASLEQENLVCGKQMMKNLKMQASTCYLVRFLMVVEGRVVKRKQTPVVRRPEWDSQESITFDLVSVSVEQPSFVVALVMRNASGSTGSLQNLRQHCCGCPPAQSGPNQPKRPNCVQSEPEAVSGGQHQQQQQQSAGANQHQLSCALYRSQLVDCWQNQSRARTDLVIGHLVLADEIWAELRAQPRKQIVRQFKMY